MGASAERQGPFVEFAVRVRGDADVQNPPLIEFNTVRSRKGPELFLTRAQGGDGLWSYRTDRLVAKARTIVARHGILMKIRRSALPRGRLHWRATTLAGKGQRADHAPDVGYLSERL